MSRFLFSSSFAPVKALSMLLRKNQICVVCDFQGKNPIGAMAKRVGRAFHRKVVFADTEVGLWIYNPLLKSEAKAQGAMNNVLKQVEESLVTHLHLELGLFGNTLESMRNNILSVIEKSHSLVLFIHSLHMNDATFAPLYKEILEHCEKKRKTNEVILFVNNKKDQCLAQNHFLGNMVFFPVMYLTQNHRRWLIREGARLSSQRPSDVRFVGVFGYINAHKDFETTLKAFSLLPQSYHLVIAGGAHPGERQMHVKNPSIVALDQLLWSFRDTGLLNRIHFYDSLGDKEFFTLMSSLDAVIINYLETAMSASSVLSQALELGVPVVTSRCTTFEMAQDHFGKSFAMFDPGNSLQLKQKIQETVEKSKAKTALRQPSLFSMEEFCKRISL